VPHNRNDDQRLITENYNDHVQSVAIISRIDRLSSTLIADTDTSFTLVTWF